MKSKKQSKFPDQLRNTKYFVMGDSKSKSNPIVVKLTRKNIELIGPKTLTWTVPIEHFVHLVANTFLDKSISKEKYNMLKTLWKIRKD